MKRLFFVACLGIASLAAQARDITKISYKARQTFKDEYGITKNPVWKKVNAEMAKAIFENNGKETTVFISNDGELLATTIALQISDLPSKLKNAVQEIAAGSDIKELFYLENDSEKAYYFSVEKAGVKKVYRGAANGKIEDVSNKVG
ncbi:MAG TPA: hypothetical protein VLC98_12075 [Phnomibacter sp.]|nr:hypothetical protein [Phnomibacter sp.]